MRPWYTFDEFRARVGLHNLPEEYKEHQPYGTIQEYLPSYPKNYICPAATYALNNSEDDLYAMDRSYGLNAHVFYYKHYITNVNIFYN